MKISKITGLIDKKRLACVKIILANSISYLHASCFVNQYSWGVFNGFCSNRPKDANHGVLVVGFTKSEHILKFLLSIIEEP